MAEKVVQPSIKARSFNCPHCGALAHQTWYEVSADRIKEDGLPFKLTPEETERLISDVEKSEHDVEPDVKARWRRQSTGEMFLYRRADHAWSDYDVQNLWVSNCFSCKRDTLWLDDRFIWPAARHGPAPNQDLTGEIIRDFEEARSIVGLSPRGAAALARLCIQKLCIFLGEPGKNLNIDIGSLVAKGLDPQVQQALDIVRINGNNAVHPGEIDLRDDQETVMKLFGLINFIADAMVTRPKQMAAIFGSLPPDAKAQIAQRDGGGSKKI